jgi:hypothetical protein
MDTINVKKLLSKQFKKNNFCRYDIVLRYLFIEGFLDSDKSLDFDYEPYNLMLIGRGRKYNPRDFMEMIKSFEKYGFNKEFPIVLDSKKIMRNGAHRVACCLWFNINEIPFRINERKEGRLVFSTKWMSKHGLEDQLPILEKAKSRLFKKIGL